MFWKTSLKQTIVFWTNYKTEFNEKIFSPVSKSYTKLARILQVFLILEILFVFSW